MFIKLKLIKFKLIKFKLTIVFISTKETSLCEHCCEQGEVFCQIVRI